MTVQSKVGEGTTVTVALPLAFTPPAARRPTSNIATLKPALRSGLQQDASPSGEEKCLDRFRDDEMPRRRRWRQGGRGRGGDERGLVMRVLLHSPKDMLAGRARRCRRRRDHRQCAVPAGRPSSVADVRHRSSRCRRRGRAGRCQPVAASAPGRGCARSSNWRRPSVEAGRAARLSRSRDADAKSPMPNLRIPRPHDPMTNLVVKSTSAPARGRRRMSRVRRRRSRVAAKPPRPRLAAHRGGAARADRIWLRPVEADRHDRRRHPGRDPEIRARAQDCR